MRLPDEHGARGGGRSGHEGRRDERRDKPQVRERRELGCAQQHAWVARGRQSREVLDARLGLPRLKGPVFTQLPRPNALCSPCLEGSRLAGERGIVRSEGNLPQSRGLFLLGGGGAPPA